MQAIDYAKNASASFALPEICLRIREMLDDHQSDVDDIGNLISLDPSLASKLLKLANSPLFRFRSQVDNIGKAVSILGGEALYNLVMAETAKDAFDSLSSENMDLKRFWRQSLYTGLLAKHMAKLARIRGSERFFLLGLLHNLAELVVTKQSPELAAKCIPTDHQILPFELQKDILGFTYPQCSSTILQLWQLPTQISMTIMHIADQDYAMGNKEVAIMHVASIVGYLLATQFPGKPEEVVNSAIFASVDLDVEILVDAITFSNQEINQMMSIFSPN
ncbi:HDOD domain-containing protein [Aliiglaciecola sp. 3_MG-2023]|uniref:HDOD domain-containing protein n=1 Tax=Aliiglaciecola sp. 3_MG-2023 TaxID=3062644 RepID=UPI0026E2015A|nr:HDOD domain-containing protein [Aliiglaciecola sp. 3_MG-2023]MDO6695002.1 HDOD domain-containing protein [Aliiglaciecola sp. 3_MG-2023]